MADQEVQEKKKETVVKKRVWEILAYPESMPENWKDVIRGFKVATVVSPLHDKDVMEDGSPKKPHYHIMAFWDGPVTDSVARKLSAALGNPSLNPVGVNSTKAAFRYLWHADEEQNGSGKHVYSKDDLLCFNGFSEEDHVGAWSNAEKDEIVARLEALILEDILPVPNLLSLVRYLNSEGMLDELKYLRRNTFYITSLLAARRGQSRDTWMADYEKQVHSYQKEQAEKGAREPMEKETSAPAPAPAPSPFGFVPRPYYRDEFGQTWAVLPSGELDEEEGEPF